MVVCSSCAAAKDCIAASEKLKDTFEKCIVMCLEMQILKCEKGE
jgi:hypothetical protein